MYKIKLVQENPKVGDIQGNLDLAKSYISEAKKKNINMIIFSEMFLTGYPPEDLLLREDFLRASERCSLELQALSKDISIVIGCPSREEENIYNSALFFQKGKLAKNYKKQILPNYKEFDEKRYFQKGESHEILEDGDLKFGISICEDIWDEKYIKEIFHQDIDLLINISASPFTIDKKSLREEMLCNYFTDFKKPIIYVNQVGGQDELVFDGSSLVIDSKDSVKRLKSFEIDEVIIGVDKKNITSNLKQDSVSRIGEISDIYQALVLGTRDYVQKNNFKGILIGSSGGIDSALTAAIASDALGPEKVNTVMMPFKYTADMSIEDAQQLAENLGFKHEVIPISEMFKAFKNSLDAKLTPKESDKTEENLQSRCRGVTLMALSNNLGYLVLTTGNKSEAAVGYSTLYGDTAGGFSVLRDVYKTTVYDLAKYRNSLGEVIPQRIIDREPSAELSEDQKDSDSLPTYDLLDPIIEAYVEDDKTKKEIIDSGFNSEDVKKVIDLINFNEYKRRQVPLGIKISARNFGKDRRYPITNYWKNNI
tara:strand:+ start:4442 stop:6055 length:1614 start_codon:yes stop_codon:yes gene_type:complete